jgi:hypothetical protein
MSSSRQTKSILKKINDPNKRRKTVRINSKNQINEIENLKLETALNTQTPIEYKLARQEVRDAKKSFRAMRRLVAEAAAQKARRRLINNATDNHPTNPSSVIQLTRSRSMHVPSRSDLENHPKHAAKGNGILNFISGVFGRTRRGGWRVNSKTKTKKRRSLK